MTANMSNSQRGASSQEQVLSIGGDIVCWRCRCFTVERQGWLCDACEDVANDFLRAEGVQLGLDTLFAANTAAAALESLRIPFIPTVEQKEMWEGDDVVLMAEAVTRELIITSFPVRPAAPVPKRLREIDVLIDAMSEARLTPGIHCVECGSIQIWSLCDRCYNNLPRLGDAHIIDISIQPDEYWTPVEPASEREYDYQSDHEDPFIQNAQMEVVDESAFDARDFGVLHDVPMTEEGLHDLSCKDLGCGCDHDGTYHMGSHRCHGCQRMCRITVICETLPRGLITGEELVLQPEQQELSEECRELLRIEQNVRNAEDSRVDWAEVARQEMYSSNERAGSWSNAQAVVDAINNFIRQEEADAHNAAMHALNGNIEMAEMIIVGFLFLCGLAAVFYFMKLRHSFQFDLFDMSSWHALGFESTPAEFACWVLAFVGVIKLVYDRVCQRSLESKSKTLEFLSGAIDSLTVVAIGYVMFKDGVMIAPKVFSQIRTWVAMLYTTINGLKFLQRYFPSGLGRSWIKPEIIEQAAAEAVQFTEEVDDENVPESWGLDRKRMFGLSGTWFNYPKPQSNQQDTLNTWRQRAANSLASFEELMGRKKVSDMEKLTGVMRRGLGYQPPSKFEMAMKFMRANPLFMIVGLVAMIALLRALYKYVNSTVSKNVTESFNASDNKPHPMTLESQSVSGWNIKDSSAHPATIRQCKHCNTITGEACCVSCVENLETGRRKKKVKHVQTTYSGGNDITVNQGFETPEPESPNNRMDDNSNDEPIMEAKKGQKWVKKGNTQTAAKRECVPKVSGKGLEPCPGKQDHNPKKFLQAVEQLRVKRAAAAAESHPEFKEQPQQKSKKQNAAESHPEPKEQLFINSTVVQEMTQKVSKQELTAEAKTEKKKPCKFGDHCHNNKCEDYHTTKMCVHGASCQYIGSCFFYHPNIKMTSKGKSLFSRVAAATPKLESLNGRKQFKAGKALAVTKGIFNNPTSHPDTFDSHSVMYGGKVIMTEHGYEGCGEVYLCGQKIDKNRFVKSKTCIDLMMAPIPANMSYPNVKADIPEKNMSEDVYICATYPEVAIAQGQLVCRNGGEFMYTAATEPGNSGMGVWTPEGKLIGFHRSGGNGKPNGFIPITQEFLDEIHGKSSLVSKNE